MSKVFISYSHKQGDWVWGRLLPCLRAGGAEVLIDIERFKVGHAVVGQMDAVQDQADRHLLIFSPDYLSSPYCRHEMDRAIALDPPNCRLTSRAGWRWSTWSLRGPCHVADC